MWYGKMHVHQINDADSDKRYVFFIFGYLFLHNRILNLQINLLLYLIFFQQNIVQRFSFGRFLYKKTKKEERYCT